MTSWTNGDDGPKLKVPRPVWQMAFVVCFLVGMAPWLILSVRLDEMYNTSHSGDPDTLLIFARAVVFGVYVAAIGQGIKQLLRWLFGPIPQRRRDRKPAN